MDYGVNCCAARSPLFSANLAEFWVCSRQVPLADTPYACRIGSPARLARLSTFGDLIDLHVGDMCVVGKAPRRSKAATLDQLKRELGSCNMVSLDRERLIRFGRERAKQGAGPVTLGIDIGTIKLVLSHAAAVHGLQVRVDQVDLARIALKRLGLVGKGRERDRRPTQDELDRLCAHFDGNPRQISPAGRIVRFAVATAMRQDEIMRVRWSDVDPSSPRASSRVARGHGQCAPFRRTAKDCAPDAFSRSSAASRARTANSPGVREEPKVPPSAGFEGTRSPYSS